MSEAVAAQIRAEQAAARLTLKETADRAGIPFSTYRGLNDGTGVADSAQLQRLCKVFGITLSEFFRRVESRLIPNDANEMERRRLSG